MLGFLDTGDLLKTWKEGRTGNTSPRPGGSVAGQPRVHVTLAGHSHATATTTHLSINTSVTNVVFVLKQVKGGAQCIALLCTYIPVQHRATECKSNCSTVNTVR